MITQKDYQLLAKHVLADISYKEGGTFYMGHDEFDRREANRVEKILGKILRIVERSNK